VPKTPKPDIPDPHLIQMRNRVMQIFGVFARLPFTMRNQIHLSLKRQLTRILRMLAVDDKAERIYLARNAILCISQCIRLRCPAQKTHAPHNIKINARNLFTLHQILPGCICMRGIHLKRQAATGPAPIQTKHQPGLFRCAAMNVRENTERTMVPVKPGSILRLHRKPRSPHQRPIPKNPQIRHHLAMIEHYV
tara:strand:+ start:2060 stop:2638 length:579 start_codon:yes stop_codon:yes gene_type:complete